MKISNIALLLGLTLLLSCGSNKPEKPEPKPRMLVTSQLLKGLNYGFNNQVGNISYYHLVEFETDSTAFMLMGGDVLEICSYYTMADSVYVTVIHTDPPYTEVFGYVDGDLVDRRGNVWKVITR